MMTIGSQFPTFSLANQDGVEVTSKILTGQWTIVYFYPKDDTSGCTTQACGFQATLPEFKGASVIGVSPDSVKSHRKFADKYGLKFDLLADEAHILANACGVWVEKSMYGKKYMGIERTTYLVDPKGIISHFWPKVKPAGHAEEVLTVIAAAK